MGTVISALQYSGTKTGDIKDPGPPHNENFLLGTEVQVIPANCLPQLFKPEVLVSLD